MASAAGSASDLVDSGPATMAMAGVGPATMATIIRITAVIRTRKGTRIILVTATADTDTVTDRSAMATAGALESASVESDSAAVDSPAEDGVTFPAGTE